MHLTLGLVFRVLLFLALVAGFILFLAAPLPPAMGSRLILLFGAGAWLAFFVEGPEWGTFERRSARPLVVVLGVLAMGAATLWAWSVRGAVRP